jgi:hypothetical protein
VNSFHVLRLKTSFFGGRPKSFSVVKGEGTLHLIQYHIESFFQVLIARYNIMLYGVRKTGSTSPSTTLRLSRLAPTQETFMENVKRVHYLAIMWRSTEARNPLILDPELLSIRMIVELYFEIVTIVRFSNWNSTSSRFHYAIYLVWLQE